MNSGRIEVDQAALTGESLPVTVHGGGDALMGSTVTRGEVEGTVMVCERTDCTDILLCATVR